jgi:hypothetical protein
LPEAEFDQNILPKNNLFFINKRRADGTHLFLVFSSLFLFYGAKNAKKPALVKQSSKKIRKNRKIYIKYRIRRKW